MHRDFLPVNAKIFKPTGQIGQSMAELGRAARWQHSEIPQQVPVCIPTRFQPVLRPTGICVIFVRHSQQVMGYHCTSEYSNSEPSPVKYLTDHRTGCGNLKRDCLVLWRCPLRILARVLSRLKFWVNLFSSSMQQRHST